MSLKKIQGLIPMLKKIIFTLIIFNQIFSSDTWLVRIQDVLQRYENLDIAWRSQDLRHKPTIFLLKERAQVISNLLSSIEGMHENLRQIVKNFSLLSSTKTNSMDDFIKLHLRIKAENERLIEGVFP